MEHFDHTNHTSIDAIYNRSNYKVTLNNDINAKSITVVYFSSNGIYFPNTLDTFSNTIVKNDRYEWSKKTNQLQNVKKSIFVRDIYKQWYLKGINKEINNIDKLIEFIRQEHNEKELILVGTSSGGYIATLIGIKLKANKVFNFAGQLTLETVLNDGKDKIVNNAHKEWYKYYNLSSLLANTTTNIFYFVCEKSSVDYEHILLAKKYPAIKEFIFDCNFHGVPFSQISLKYLLPMDTNSLLSLYNEHREKSINPKIFWKHFVNPMSYYVDIVKYIFLNIKKIPRYIIYKIKSKNE